MLEEMLALIDLCMQPLFSLLFDASRIVSYIVCFPLTVISQSFGEDIGESDTEGFSVEDDYEKDSFIDDSDPEVFAPSPSTSDESRLFGVLLLFGIMMFHSC